MHSAARTSLTLAGLAGLAGAATLGYALWEAQSYRLRHVTVPVHGLEAGESAALLHLSDLHLTPHTAKRAEWVRRLAEVEPDVVVVTGDFLAHAESVPVVAEALAGLLELPGAYVFGSNDYYVPTFKNPTRYLRNPSQPTTHRGELPTSDLRDLLAGAGWLDLNNREGTLQAAGLTFAFKGTDDPHIGVDDYAQIAGPYPQADIRIGVTHAPYLRVLGELAADHPDLLLAGHTHGGQVCLPGYGALVTNCDLPTDQASGLSSFEGIPLHVSAGLGTSPFTPVRVACPPEATVIRLVGAG